MKVRPPRERISIEADGSEGNYVVKQKMDLADHVLVVGERYQPVDFKSISSLFMGKFTSGIMRKI